MTDTLTWTHKGVTITFNAVRATFRAETNGKVLTGKPLDVVKKKIDGEVKFEPFDALEEVTGYMADRPESVEKAVARANNAVLIPIRIVGFDAKEKKFLTAAMGCHWTVLKPGEESIAAWLNFQKAVKHRTDRISELDDEVAVAKHQVQIVSASNYESESET